MSLTLKRLEELDRNIMMSMGWNAKETPSERREILKKWNKMDGNTSFHDAIKLMIKEKSRGKRK